MSHLGRLEGEQRQFGHLLSMAINDLLIGWSSKDIAP